MTVRLSKSKSPLGKRFLRAVTKYWQLYLLFLPVLAWYIIFCYMPMGGVSIAFRKFSVIRGIAGSPWVGWENFEKMFEAPMFWRAFRNTLIISFQNLLIGFPIPILFALLVNEIRNSAFKKTVQTISYLPHFISWSVVGGLVYMLLSLNTGTINNVIVAMGGTAQNFTGMNAYFRGIVVVSGIWKNMGWSAIVYLAAITGVDEELYEAAYIDGANRFNRLWHITRPGIRTTISVMLILQVGNLMTVGFEKAFLMQNPLNLETSEIISTFVYKMGLNYRQYSYSTAIGLFNSVINMILLVSVNTIAGRLSETSLW